ncbi:MAG TPA: hypothetical protein VEI54_01410 [Candidatus Limnocylindrales bacterium]|nr:hypothetical protein [Candidatus Limnocylindrales bacterium]
MRLHLRFAALFAVLVVATLPLLAATRIAHRWVLTGAPVPQFQKILVASIVENYLVRREFEDELKRLLARHGVEGVQSYVVLPPKNEMMEGELKQRIKESALDSVLVIRPKAARKETRELGTGEIYAPPPGYTLFWPYWNLVYGDFSPTSSTKENSTVRVEFNLFSTKDEKLVWSGESDTVYSKDFEKRSKEYARMLVDQLKKDKLIKKK